MRLYISSKLIQVNKNVDRVALFFRSICLFTLENVLQNSIFLQGEKYTNLNWQKKSSDITIRAYKRKNRQYTHPSNQQWNEYISDNFMLSDMYHFLQYKKKELIYA